MTFPVDAGRAITQQTSGADPWTVNLPGSIAADDTLFMSARNQGANTISTPAGWSLLTDTSAAPDPSGDFHYLFWAKATGSEGATMSLDISTAVKGCVIVWRITGAADPTVTPPEFSTIATGSTGANTADPGSLSPSGGSQDYLWLALMGQDGELNEPTAGPTDYNDNFQAANSGTAGAVASNCTMGGGTRQFASASAAPGTFTHATPNSGWCAWTIAFSPAEEPPSDAAPLMWVTTL